MRRSDGNAFPLAALYPIGEPKLEDQAFSSALYRDALFNYTVTLDFYIFNQRYAELLHGIDI